MKCEQLVFNVTSKAESFECGCRVGYHINMSTFQQCEGISYTVLIVILQCHMQIKIDLTVD